MRAPAPYIWLGPRWYASLEFGPDNRQFTDFSALCREIGEPERIVATAWTLHHPAVASAIVGVRTVDQLDALDRAAALLARDLTSGRVVPAAGVPAASCLDAVLDDVGR